MAFIPLKPCVRCDIEGEDAVGALMPFQDFRMTQGADGVVATRDQCSSMLRRENSKSLDSPS